MEIHRFEDEDLRILASLAIDFETDHLFFKVVRVVKPESNYWSFDCRFTYDKNQIDTYYDSLHINCGSENTPQTYQMSWNTMKDGLFKARPVTSPLVVVHYFEEMCGKSQIIQN